MIIAANIIALLIIHANGKEITGMSSLDLAPLLWLAFMVEFLTEAVRMNCPGANKLPAGTISSALGILLCYLTETGILEIIGNYSRAPVMDYIITGLIISRGSGVVHDFISALQGVVRSYTRRL